MRYDWITHNPWYFSIIKYVLAYQLFGNPPPVMVSIIVAIALVFVLMQDDIKREKGKEEGFHFLITAGDIKK